MNKNIFFYVLTSIIVLMYFIYIYRFYKEQFKLHPLTFIQDNDTVFLITQNLYCYDGVLQIALEDAVNLIAVLPADIKKMIIDAIRSTNSTNSNDFALSVLENDKNEPEKFISEIMLNPDISNNMEITIELVNKNPTNNVLDGDLIYLKYKSSSGEYIIKRDNNNIVFEKIKEETKYKEDNNYIWIIKIDRFYSTDSFDSKISNYMCILIEVYNPSGGDSNIRTAALGTNCDSLKQSEIVGGKVLEILGKIDLKKLPETISQIKTAIEDSQPVRTIEVSPCIDCYHWQIRQK